jgi:hypothetical protein
VRQIFRQNACTVIRNVHQRVPALRNARTFTCDIRIVEHDIRGFNLEMSAFRHRVPRVGSEIHKYLFDLNRIHSYKAQPTPPERM